VGAAPLTGIEGLGTGDATSSDDPTLSDITPTSSSTSSLDVPADTVRVFMVAEHPSA
jgi:hypothetical protein